MFCPVCGTLNEDYVPFCGGCGARLSVQNPVIPQVNVQQSYYQVQSWTPQGRWQMTQPAGIPGKGLAIAGMILGISSLVLGVVWVLSGICAVLAIVFSALAQAKARKAGRNNGMAIAGLICGGIGLAIAVLFGSAVLSIISGGYQPYADLGMEYTYNA